METNLPNPPKSKPTRYLRLFFVIIGAIALCATAYQIAMNTAFHGNLHATSTVDHIVLPIVHIIAAVFFLVLVIRALRIMKWFDRFWLSLYTWQGMRRALVGLAILATLLAAFYAEENWRGKRAWEKCKAELEAQGEKLDWKDYVPAPVPDDQNIFKAPKMKDWFVRQSWSAMQKGNRTNELTEILNTPPLSEFIQKLHPNPVARITIVTSADPQALKREGLWLRYNGRVLDTAEDFLKVDAGNSKVAQVQHTNDSKVGVATSAHQVLKKSLEESLSQSVSTNSKVLLSDVRLHQFITGTVPPLKTLPLIVRADRVPSIKEMKEFFPSDLNKEVLAGRYGWRVEATGSNTFNVYFQNETYISAADYLAWSDQFAAQFEIIREGLKRPQAQVDGDFNAPYLMPIPDFVCVRTLAQTLAERAQCYLLLGQPDKALKELTMIRDMHRLMDGRPMTLVAAMINVAITGLHTAIIGDGFRLNAWGDAELVALQKQLAEIELSPNVAFALRAERAATSHSFLTMDARQITGLVGQSDRGFWARVTDPAYLLLKFLPRGWIYQNLVIGARLEQDAFLDAYDRATQVYTPAKAGNGDMIGKAFEPWTPFNALARIAVPNFIRAMQVTARNQTLVNQTLIACGLERYHRGHGSYPETLDALVPQFIAKVPHDVIGGQPLKYHRTDDGKFLLYSVGWNAIDDGGKVTREKSGLADVTSPDWVWQTALP